MNIAEKLVEIIKDERRERGKSCRAIAEEIGVHRNTLMNVKWKHGWCTLYVANQILEGLGYELIIRKKKGRENEEGKAEKVREAMRSFRC